MRFYTWVSNIVLAIALSFAFWAPANAQTILIMFDEEGCPYCEQWSEEIGPIYSKTEEGKRAPLLRMDIDAPLPEGITIVSDPIYTPTFVLIDNGQEVDRLLGYPGEDFFWGLLGRMLDKLPEQNTEGSS